MMDFNTAGVPSEDFLVEVSESARLKKNQLYFALAATGIAGEPDFGLGLQSLVWEEATEDTGDIIRDFLSERLPEAVDGITLENVEVTAMPASKTLGINIVAKDTETGEDVGLPIGIGRL